MKVKELLFDLPEPDTNYMIAYDELLHWFKTIKSKLTKDEEKEFREITGFIYEYTERNINRQPV